MLAWLPLLSLFVLFLVTLLSYAVVLNAVLLYMLPLFSLLLLVSSVVLLLQLCYCCYHYVVTYVFFYFVVVWH